MTSGADDPLSMVAQIMRQIQPTIIEAARERERQNERERRKKQEYKEKNKERMRQARAKK